MPQRPDRVKRRIGGPGEVAWINEATTGGFTITSAVPPLFAAYATIVIPDADGDKTRSDAALIGVLSRETAAQPWWLGYLDTGVADTVVPDAAMVTVYAGWPYVLLEGGPEQALGLRRNADFTPWHSALPELLFPADRSWLVSTLWDDDWRCVGGPAALVDALVRHPVLDARAVALDEDAAPPGHGVLRMSPRDWVNAKIAELRATTYGELLLRLERPEYADVDDSGELFVGEVNVFWDDREGGNVRVIVDAWRRPVIGSRTLAKDDFVRAPDGSFVGE